ncbi:DUF726 domain-containing protein [Thalassovita taeanensis]|uniref:Alpha/beta hydrolase family protein n=1 Tax=Thalassovita taeanensis TaxID=657014 RepID=A0A1H9ETA2_9RHOB|nr:DUF726 domain-containing protein [Thalassovita taeanensis]SEQ28865.1 Alpha/beta hydrolase of unknown function [Thalassovita taeanensis]
MPLLRINATNNGPRLHGADRPLMPTLAHAANGDGPVIIMVHGYKFAPGSADNCPHDHILSMREDHDCPKALSWPRALGFGTANADEGLGLAFGWSARGSVWQAYARAEEAGADLAQVIAALRRLAPHRPIHALAHSMGARVVLSALRRLPGHSVNRVILLAGAEYQTHANEALNSPAGQSAEVINITSRENDFYDFLLERLISPPVRGDLTIGAHLSQRPNALTLQLDDPVTLRALAWHGFRIDPPQRRVCHWSAYLRPGVFDLYRALLRAPQRHPLAQLRPLLPDQPAPRWSRLFAWPALPHSLPLTGKAPS